MIPPADGLNERELGLLVNIIKEIEIDGKGWINYSFVNRNAFKNLCQYGVIGVATVTYNHWQHSPRTSFTKDGFVVWVTELGHQYMRGEVDVSKPCTLENKYWTSYGKCKRHNKYHLREEHEAYNSTKAC